MLKLIGLLKLYCNFQSILFCGQVLYHLQILLLLMEDCSLNHLHIHSYIGFTDLPLTDIRSSWQNLQQPTHFVYINVITLVGYCSMDFPLLVALSLCLIGFIFINFYNHIVRRKIRKAEFIPFLFSLAPTLPTLTFISLIHPSMATSHIFVSLTLL